MFVIMVYDVNVKRVSKVLKCARKYLNWVQNSVLEGDITEGTYHMLYTEVKNILDEEVDSCLFYTFRSPKYNKRELLGIKKGGEELFL